MNRVKQSQLEMLRNVNEAASAAVIRAGLVMLAVLLGRASARCRYA